MIVIVLEVDEQVPADVIDHSKMFVPNERFVTVELAAKLFVMIPLPDITLHVPVPVVGVFAAKVALGELIQTV